MAMDAMLREAQKYVGMGYVVGEFDCADLAVLVQREVFARDVALPATRNRPGGRRSQAREINRWRDALAVPIDAPVTGCAVLLSEPDDGGRTWHVGTVFMDAHQVWVLHNNFVQGSAALQRLSDLRLWGMRLEGYYQWT